MRDAIMRNVSLFIASFLRAGQAFDRGTPTSACVVVLEFMTVLTS